MTSSQLKWASQHDWYISTTSDNGVIVRDFEIEPAKWTLINGKPIKKEGSWIKIERVFTDFQALYEWAGY